MQVTVIWNEVIIEVFIKRYINSYDKETNCHKLYLIFTRIKWLESCCNQMYRKETEIDGSRDTTLHGNDKVQTALYTSSTK
jgi:hypothetical protein